MPDNDKGFYNKFDVTRKSTGEVVDPADSFTLVVSRDPFAYAALQAYAEACESQNPALAADLLALAEKAPDYLDAEGNPVFCNGAN